MEPEKLYAQIQEFVKKEATDISTSVYEKNGTMYGVAEVPFHTHNSVDSTSFDYTNLTNRTRYIVIPVFASVTTVAIGTGIGGDYRMPFSGGFLYAGAWVQTAGTTSTTNVDININGISIFNSVIKIDSTEKTTQFADTPNVLKRPGFFNMWDILTVDVTQINTTPPVGLWVFLKVSETSI